MDNKNDKNNKNKNNKNILIILLFFTHSSMDLASAFASDQEQIWILLSMPIDPSDILFSRLCASIASSIPFSAACMMVLAVRWHVETGMFGYALLTMITACVNTAMISLYFFLRYPSFAKGRLTRALLTSMAVSYAVYIVEALMLASGRLDLAISISLLFLAGMGALLFTKGRQLFGKIGMRSL